MIHLVILSSLAVASFMLGLGRLWDRDLPPASRGEIRRDRAQRRLPLPQLQPMLPRSRRPTEPSAFDAGELRMLDAISKLYDGYRPPTGWQEMVLAAAPRPPRPIRWHPCATCGLLLSEAHNARLMPHVGVVCVPCASGKERPCG